MKKACVTGATGFLGAHLSCLLHNMGYQVLCTHRTENYELFNTIAKTYGKNQSDFKWVIADIIQIDELETAFLGCDVVFHCAAVISFYPAHKTTIFETNVNGTRNVCNVCIKYKIPLVYASSVAALGRTNAQEFITENTEWVDSPYNSIYAVSKNLAELEVWRAITEGLDCYILNPGVILGFGDGNNGSNAIFRHIRKKSPFYPIGKNGFVGVHDVCKAMVGAYEGGLKNRRILLVSENLTYKTLLSMVAKSMHLKGPTWALRGALLHFLIFISRFSEFFRIPFPFPSQGLLSTASTSVYSGVNSKEIIGFVYTPIQQVIENTVALMNQPHTD